MKLDFYKYHGTGNDFIILDNRDDRYNGLTKDRVNKLCDRHFGIGADGLMLLNELKGYDFQMIYYNADGAESSMCGNGGRCLVKFAADKGIDRESYCFLAIDGEHLANFDNNGWVRLKMKDVDTVSSFEKDAIIDTGSPHYVKLVKNVAALDVYTEGKAIRYNETFKEKGINVNFVQKVEGKVRVRTYERGVEDETLSCGTGVTASALLFAKAEGFNRVNIVTPGGELAVEFIKKGDKEFTDVWLCGPATFVFKGEIEI